MTEPEPEGRRRRPAVSCSLCRRRKIRCNRETPCSNCVRSRNETCVYKNHPSQPPRQHLGHGLTTELGLAQESREPHYSTPIDRASGISRGSTVTSHPSKSLVASSTSASTLASQPSARDVESMKSRIKKLEEKLSKATQRSTQSPVLTPSSNIETTTSCIAGTFYIHHESRLFGQAQVISRSVMHKTRLFGQSHWFIGAALFRDILEIIEPHVREETSKAFSGIQRCKYLARVIKSRRSPPWPSPTRADLPPKDVANELVDCYLRTTETVYRILHVPSFRRDYETLWVPDTEPDTAFLVQLKLVLAIGATSYDQQFLLRASAIQWVYEAQTWFSEPEFKSRLSIQALQTNLLLLLARETSGMGGDSIWILAGALLRTAVYMGLHRDPASLPKRTTFAAEMRRRLWNTILEITLQSSMSSGGPPLVSLADFDTEPPGNFDDDQLVAEDATPKPEDDFTQVSIAIALRKTFPLRLAITKFLNDLGSHGTYEEALRLDAELRASYKALCRTLQGCHSSSASQFEIRVVDFLMRRYLSSLHIPFFGPALHETAYAFSRKVVIETSLKIWCATFPSSSIMAAPSLSDSALSDRDDFARLTVCGSGFFRTVAIQASLVIAMELKAQLQEEESLGPVPLRPDLLSVLDDAKTWSLRCIEAGETTIKGYLFMCLVAAQIEGLVRGLGKDEFPELLVKAAEEAEERCLPILEEMAAQGQTEGTVDVLNQMSLNTPPKLMEDWDFIMSDAQFNFGNAEPMSWVFNDETTQEPTLW